MEATTRSFPQAKIINPPTRSSSFAHPFISSKPSVLPFQFSAFPAFHVSSSGKLKCRATPINGFVGVRASDSEAGFTEKEDKWLLKPVGDGDCKHIGYKVPMPDAFEIPPGVVSIGRVPEKADIVIPVATVSALHARVQQKDGNLAIMDMDSTNGTFIDGKRLRPGVVARLSPGNRITFGDDHLAVFEVSVSENLDASGKMEDPEARVEAEEPTGNSSSTS